MVQICGHEIIERILKIIKRKRILKIIKRNKSNNYNDKIGHITNNDIEHNKDINSQMCIKKRIAKLIKENEKYFIYEIMNTTADAILHSTHDMERLKMLGYSHGVAVDIFEKYGIFLYVTDLSTSTNAPNVVKQQLQMLINIYGLEKVAEEIVLCLKENYPNQFGINIVCTP